LAGSGFETGAAEQALSPVSKTPVLPNLERQLGF